MRPIRSLLIFMVVVFVGGALLAPWLYWLARASAEHWPAMGKMASQPFPRFLDRALLGMAIVCLYPLLRSCGMLHGRDLGLAGNGGRLSGAVRGFFLGFISLALAALLAILLRERSFNTARSGRAILGGVGSAALTAVIVAVLEEFIFRGTLFGILRKVQTWPEALVLSSAVYAIVHFIQKATFIGLVQAWSGLVLLPKMFQGGPSFVPMFLTLFLAGSILALAYQRTGTIFFSIGLHAGWIFWLKAYGFLTTQTSTRWSGTDKLIDGWLALPILGCVFCIVWRMKPAAERSHVR